VSTIIYDVKDRICTITMNRPEVLNALNVDLIQDLDDGVRRAAEDPDVKIVILTGAGRGFCSGGDVRGAATPSTDSAPAKPREPAPRGKTAYQLLHDMPKPTIAMINGPVAGAGIGLAGACDLRIAAESATFLTAFARWGLSGDYGSTYFWPRILGAGKARELFMLNEKLDAQQALAAGVYTRVVPDTELKAAVDEIAARLVRTSSHGWAGMKDSLNKGENLPITEALENEQNNMGRASQARGERRMAEGRA
jgi:2-(1,2-epoxy-1,2-dihydrophenyl)acetyl-CoA isomerase